MAIVSTNAPNYNGPIMGYEINHELFGDYEGPDLIVNNNT